MNNLNDDVVINKKKYILCLNLTQEAFDNDSSPIYYDEVIQKKENDINNVCFICQLTRDGSLAKRIDFNEHVTSKHYMWNYVYFMIYLHISNSNDFDAIQNYVWEKLVQQDNSWIPSNSDV